jgi:hypothetical protein
LIVVNHRTTPSPGLTTLKSRSKPKSAATELSAPPLVSVKSIQRLNPIAESFTDAPLSLKSSP